MELQSMTNAELVGVYNELGPEKPLTTWKRGKDILIDRIKELQAQKAPKKREGPTIRETALDLLCEVAYYEDKTLKSSPENVVAEDHPNARSVGIPYLEIIERIKGQFDGAKTSVACLRWYAVKIRAEEFGYEDYRLVQRRPRAKPVK